MKKLTAILILAALLLFAGCAGTSPVDIKKAQVVAKLLAADNIPIVALKSSGDSFEAIYEASDADDYDAQMIVDWGTIFAAASNFNYSRITIINTINDEPFAKLTTSSENVKALGDGLINESVFWDNVEIKALK